MLPFIRPLLCFSLLGLASLSGATEISVAPSTQATTPGMPVTVDVLVSGLGDGTAPSIGAYDIRLGFDSAVLSLADPQTDITFGTGLDIFGFGTLTDIQGTNPVDVAETSFDDPADIDALQPNAFTLFSVVFTALAEGVSAISVSVNSITDADGSALTIDSVVGGQVQVSPLPIPGVAVLLSLGLGLMAGQRALSHARTAGT